MSTLRSPSDPRNQSMPARASLLWRRLIAPHPSVTDARKAQRAQLLSIFSFLMTVVFISAAFFQPKSTGIFLAFGIVAITSYLLSKTIYHRAGSYLFTYLYAAIGFVRIYQGSAKSIEASIAYTIPAALIVSSILLPKRGFLGLVILSATAIFAIPIYSIVPAAETDSIGRNGALALVIGALLYGINIYRENLDKEKNKELIIANRELKNEKGNLEDHIKTHTIELKEAVQKIEDRAVRLQVLAKLSEEIASGVAQKPKEYLTHIAQVISEALDYYHVGIFLIDERHEYAALRASNSQGGQQMLARRHQLKVGGTGLVGYVSQSGRLRIALDTGADAVFFNNPDLPETRSEIALPLKYGNSIIGVLDVQSVKASAFNAEDVNTLSPLANQIAIAIWNIQTMDADGSSELSTRPTQRAGIRLNRKQAQLGYTFTPDGVLSSAVPENNPTFNKAISSGEPVILNQTSKDASPALAVPVKLRDQVIGVIHIEATESNRKWTEDEVAMVQAISERAALALENARLFENATRRAEQEETIARVTSRIGSSTDFNNILQTTIQELGQALGASRSFIQLGTPSENGHETKAE